MGTAPQVLHSLEELKVFAHSFIHQWSNGAKVALLGELGAGKTAFVRACIDVLAEAASITNPRVMSPTYVVHQSYPELVRTVEHFDLYRMQGVTAEALVEIGFWESVDRAQAAGGFIFVEWADRLEESLVDFDVALRFSVSNEGQHEVDFSTL